MDEERDDYGRRWDGAYNQWITRVVAPPVNIIGTLEPGDKLVRGAQIYGRTSHTLTEAKQFARKFAADVVLRDALKRGACVVIEPAYVSAVCMPGARTRVLDLAAIEQLQP